MIFETKGGAIQCAEGDTTINVKDSQGFYHAIKFSRAVEIAVYVRVTITLYDEEELPDNYEDLIKEIIEEEGNKLDLGNDVIPQRFYGPIFSQVAGIETILIELATFPPFYQSTPMIIAWDRIAKFDADRVTVVEA